MSAHSSVAISSTLVLGHKNVWAFGDRYTGKSSAPFAAHYDGRRWTATAIPHTGAVSVTAASAVAPGDLWATVGTGGGQTLFPAEPSGTHLVHWDGHRWHLVRLPFPLRRHGDTASVLAVSDHDVWVGGGSGEVWLGETLAHWDGSRWQVLRRSVASPVPGNCVLGGLARRTTGLVALGECFPQDERGGLLSRLWRVADSQWAGPVGLRVGAKPVILGQMSGTPDGHLIWAVGWAGNSGVIARYGPRNGS